MKKQDNTEGRQTRRSYNATRIVAIVVVCAMLVGFAHAIDLRRALTLALFATQPYSGGVRFPAKATFACDGILYFS